MSLSSNQLMSFAETHLSPTPPLHSTHPTSDARDLLMLVTETDLQQVLHEQRDPTFVSYATVYAGPSMSDVK
jgi:hypothetical protein